MILDRERMWRRWERFWGSSILHLCDVIIHMPLKTDKLHSPKNSIQIFNLEFPSYINELKIWDYTFKRVRNYEKKFHKMMHMVKVIWGEFNIDPWFWSHQITATVSIPSKEKKWKLPRDDPNMKQLDDVFFLLSIFTGRNVIKKDRSEKDSFLISDHRIHQYWWQLHLSLSHEWAYMNSRTREVKSKITAKEFASPDWNKVNIGFEKGINQVFNLISSQEWQSEYEGWYFLFLFKSAVQRQFLESSFITCWTIREHIFAIKNRHWLDNSSVEQMSGDKKISYIFHTFFLKSLDAQSQKNIQRINKTRNRLIHFGRKTDAVDYKEMEMFIRLTEQLIAIILGLSPSNAFNSFESLDKFLTTWGEK